MFVHFSAISLISTLLLLKQLNILLERTLKLFSIKPLRGSCNFINVYIAFILTFKFGSTICLLRISIKWQLDLYWMNSSGYSTANFLICWTAYIRFFHSLLFDKSIYVCISLNYCGNCEIFTKFFLYPLEPSILSFTFVSTFIVLNSEFIDVFLLYGVYASYVWEDVFVINSQINLKLVWLIFPLNNLYQSPKFLHISPNPAFAFILKSCCPSFTKIVKI